MHLSEPQETSGARVSLLICSQKSAVYFIIMRCLFVLILFCFTFGTVMSIND